MNKAIVVLIILGEMGVAAIATAQPGVPQPDRHGDYWSNEAVLKGRVPQGSKLMPGSLWQVVSGGVNCRRKPGTNQPVVRQFGRGVTLQAEVGRGGSDEVLQNARDASGKPWMWVRANSLRLEDACYVRANRRYIQPAVR
jgi:hypothetical protein